MITVLWGIALISLLLLAFIYNVRTQTTLAAREIGSARLEASADAGVTLAIFDLVQTARLLPEKRRFPHDGRPIACRMSDEVVLAISVQDEEGKVDLNTASEALLRTLLEGNGVSSTDASRHVDAIIDFRDADSLRRLNGAEAEDYEAAEVSWSPNDAPFHSVDELHRVLDLPKPVAETLIPLLTVYSGRGGIDARVAPPGVKAALRRRAGAIPPAFAITSTRRAFSVRVEAVGIKGKSAFVREAVVELKRGAEIPYRLRRWRRGVLKDMPERPVADLSGLPDC